MGLLINTMEKRWHNAISFLCVKITELCLVEITEKHYLQWFNGGTYRP